MRLCGVHVASIYEKQEKQGKQEKYEKKPLDVSI